MIEVRSLPTLKLTGSFRFDNGMVSAAAVSDDQTLRRTWLIFPLNFGIRQRERLKH